MWSPSFKLGAVLCGVALAVGGCGRSSGSQALPSATPSAEAIAPSAATPSDPIVAAGARAYEHYCQLCHAKDATGYAADNAPSLVNKTFLESASDEQIAAGIRMGRPGTAMAAYGKERGGPLEESEVRAIVAFLRSKGPKARALPMSGVTGDPARGAVVFEKSCASCHGTPTTRGNAVHLHNPELLNGASPAFLRYAIVNGRPSTPMPAFQGTLSEQEISDVVTWLWGFRPAHPTPPVRDLTVPKDLPLVINPKGKNPTFTLRDERFVSAEQVRKALAAKQRIVLVDARPPSDWIQFHIPGAVSLPYHDHSQLERIPNDGTWVVAYCACPHHASGEVVDALRRKGYKNTAVLDEGILFWRDRGFPLAGEAALKPAASSSPSGGSPKPAKAPPKSPAP
jgi:cytochrome c oxidase cbb3-type subunit 3/ubiquinol-cytochrome c reductase cytochrome c subunit